ncbi:MAG: hypothetical protein BWY15_01043 [Firmicutes bacterium ADurb.Bin193]|nr:MAG: hypothetical protein BWY15_01043 [Firmicutes bacterium ADurb.Bin193]
MDLFDKLKILTDSAKYDVACTSSGVDKTAQKGGIGSASACGICHSFAADGRCISLLKVLMTNYCVFDCKYCVNRRSNDVPRAAFTPRELAELTINFYRRNYIEGLFLSSGVIKTPDYTCERMIETLRILREDYRFSGYIHAKVIPGTDSALVSRLGMLADRLSVNLELPSLESLKLLAPDKSKTSILAPMGYLKNRIEENRSEIIQYKNAPTFAPAGQSTQIIIGATPETDYHILNLTESLYKKYKLKRVFYSAYIPVAEDSLLPSPDTSPPLFREHRLYQADWLIRFYGFSAGEILDQSHQTLNPYVDPKCNWALNHLELFPIEVNKAGYDELLRVPGIGVTGARRIMTARRASSLDFDGLKKTGIVLKRAKYFITCRGKIAEGVKITQDEILRALMSERELGMLSPKWEQLSVFDRENLIEEEMKKCLMAGIPDQTACAARIETAGFPI